MLISDPKVLAIPVNECCEPLQDIRGSRHANDATTINPSREILEVGAATDTG